MRLVSVHIENFGKLQHYDTSFDTGLSVIHHDNGWGKTTLAAFIRVMFYGFANERKRNEIDNERLRYMPWQGGKYGGYVVYDYQGKRYRLEKYFERNNDTVHLYDDMTNLELACDIGQIGEQLFGIDRDSFSNTVFIAQQTCSTEVTSRISAMIGGLGSETADMSSYKPAVDLLQKKQNELTPNRKTGSISKLQQEISRLKNTLLDIDICEARYGQALDQRDADIGRYNAIEAEKTKAVATRDALATYQSVLAEKKQYQTLVNERADAEAAFNDARAYFEAGVPTIKEVEEATQFSDEIRNNTGALAACVVTESELEEYRRLTVPGHDIRKVSLDKVKTDVGAFSQVMREREVQGLTTEEAAKLSELKDLYGDTGLSCNSIDEALSLWQQKEGKATALSAKKTYLDILKQQSEKANPALDEFRDDPRGKSGAGHGKLTRLPLFIASAICCITGLVLTCFSSVPSWIGILLLVCGAAVLIWAITIVKKKIPNVHDGQGKKIEKNEVANENAGPSHIDKIQGEIEDDEEFIREVGERVSKLFATCGIVYNDMAVVPQLNKVRQDIEKLGLLESKQDRYSRSGLDEQYERLFSEVKASFIPFGIEVDPRRMENALLTLNDTKNRILDIEARNERKAALLDSIDGCRKKLATFKQIYRLSFGDDDKDFLYEVRDRVNVINDKADAYSARQKAETGYARTHDVAKYVALNEPTIQSMEELTGIINQRENDLKAISSDLSQCENRIKTLELQRDDLNDTKRRLDEAQSLLSKQKKIYNTVCLAESFLTKAKDSFLTKYMAPLQKAFDKYYTILTGDTTDMYDLDVNLNVTVKDRGSSHLVESLSEGYQDLIGLCRRMAMVEAMYKNEKPFLIFDDPFVNLDDQKLQGGLRFMQALSKEYQVIYITCNSGRKPISDIF